MQLETEKQITWDTYKEAANIKKHGVDFDEATSVVFGILSLNALNDHPHGNRWEYLGYSDKGRILYVVTVEEDEEFIRILSARKATSHEKENYEKGI